MNTISLSDNLHYTFMADFDAPSFSLGFDLDFDSELQPTFGKDSTCERAPEPTTIGGSFRTLEDDDEDFVPQVADSDPECGPEPPRILKRLRRGVGEKLASVRQRESAEVCGNGNGDDDIEEFSSQEDIRRDKPSSTQRPPMCSSSKFPLQGHRVLSTQTASQLKERKRKQVCHDPASASLETSSDKFVFPKLTISPLRRFQLLDSDSDDPSGDENVSRDSNIIDPLYKERQPNPVQSKTASEERTAKASSSIPQNEDLWKNFTPTSVCIPTPALDEVCEEYFRSVKEKNVARKDGADVLIIDNYKGFCEKNNSSLSFEQHRDLADPLPPAHHYFFHDDPRIQKLVRSRLSNFSPLGGVNYRANQQLGASVINYMSQFGHGESSKKQATQNCNAGRSSTKRSKISMRSNSTEEISHASGSWVNPKSRATIPKDAGRRRVHADGQSAGHWYTGQDGRRVYITKTGQELTGQIAYRQYKKESGARFRKPGKNKRSKKK